MPYAYYDWLSVSDIGMLAMEGESAHMHMGGVTILDPGPLWDEERGLDSQAIERYVSSRLHLIPRYRQRLAWSPIERRPVWIDDARFNIHYHVRHSSLPRAATERQLKRLVGRILSQQLDRDKPLWEMWFIEGLPDDRLAMVTKIHHCVVDGMAGMSLMDHLMRPDPDMEVEPPHPWIARNRPGAGRLAAAALVRRPQRIMRDGGALLSEPRRSLRRIRDAVVGMGQTARANARPASETPLNVEIGPHRRVDWSQMGLDDVKDVKNRLGGTVNDVVLTIVAGAVGRFLRGRGVEVGDLDFRAAMPVSTWTPDAHKEDLGNRTSFITVPLPVAESDPKRRLETVIETTQALKRSKMSLGAEALATLGEWTSAGLYSGVVQMAPRLRPFNMVVSNIPGPQKPSYLLGARQLHIYPAIPLFANQALSIGILSYEKTLHWGFNADWDSIPDLHDLVLAVDADFESLRAAATASDTARPRRGKRTQTRASGSAADPSKPRAQHNGAPAPGTRDSGQLDPGA